MTRDMGQGGVRAVRKRFGSTRAMHAAAVGLRPQRRWGQTAVGAAATAATAPQMADVKIPARYARQEGDLALPRVGS